MSSGKPETTLPRPLARRPWAARATGWALDAARALLPVAGRVWPGVAAAGRERLAAARRIEQWAASGEPSGAVWLHGASAGEILGASRLAGRVAKSTDRPFVITSTSHSAAGMRDHYGGDLLGLAPLDTPADCGRALRALQPALLVFAVGDLWPNLVTEARRAGVPIALVNGAVREGSSRLRWPVRPAMRDVFGTLDLVCAATERDAGRLERLGARADRIHVTGDAALAQVARRVDRSREEGRADSAMGRLPGRTPGGLRLVAGSIWPADVDALLRALAEAGMGELQVIWVPHEPDPRSVAGLLAELERAGRRTCRWSVRSRAAPGTDVVVDEVGPLADLYLGADLAYVGGGFGPAGLHSVTEPAAAGIPILFGRGPGRPPRREARELEQAGAAHGAGERELTAALSRWGSDADGRRLAGRAGRAYVEAGHAAEDAAFAHLCRLLAILLAVLLPG